MAQVSEKVRIAVGVPVFETVAGEALGALMTLSGEVARHGGMVVFTPVGMVPHDRARMFITNLAMEMKCSLLLFVDADTKVPVGGFTKLLEVLRTTGAVAVSGHYYRRGYPYTCVWCARNEVNGEWHHLEASSGTWEIESSGLGCCLIDLDWVQTHLQKPYFVCGKDADGTFITDDISFFTQVREKGGKILGCGDVRCGHVHSRIVIDDTNVLKLRQQHLAQTVPGLEGCEV
jgi:hypothetical protein